MKTLIAANWKMHGDLTWVEKPKQLAAHLQQGKPEIECLICPPYFMIPAMAEACSKVGISVGAQNCHFEASGAFTGEMSADMVAAAGASYVILGHSERRALFSETSEIVAAKTSAAAKARLKPILCIGERETERLAGQAFDVVSEQLRRSIPEDIDGGILTIAYEPVWAIGTGLTPTLEDIDAMHTHIRGLLVGRFGEDVALKVRVLYGGSVKPGNAREILAIPDVNGALIGGASLEMDSLAAIAKSA